MHRSSSPCSSAESSASHQALEIVAEAAEKDVADLQPDQHLIADLGVDSPKALKLLMDLEDLLDVEISDEQAAGIETVGDVLDFVAAVRSPPEPGSPSREAAG